MKRKIISLVTMAVCIAVFAGCGKGEKQAADEKRETAMESRQDTEEDTETGTGEETGNVAAISEYFGDGQKILYGGKGSELLDKSEKPGVLLFKDGKFCNPYLDLTMGELARMTDEEIFAKAEEAGKEKVQRYFENIEQTPDRDRKLGKDFLRTTGGSSAADSDAINAYAQEFANKIIDGEGTFLAEDEAASGDEEAVEEDIGQMEAIGAEIFEKVKELVADAGGARYVDLAFIVETDASGNHVESEAIAYYPNHYIQLGRNAGTGQVYDASYTLYMNARAGYDGWFYCIRDDAELVFDEINSGKENVYLDVKLYGQDINALFE